MNGFDRLKNKGRGILVASITIAISLPSYLAFAEELRSDLEPVEQQLEAEAQDVSEAEKVVIQQPAPPEFSVLQELRDFDHDLVDLTPAPARSYKQSFKDEILAFCISNAYYHVDEVKEDALYSAAAMHSWSRYEYEEVVDKISTLVNEYLAKPYRHEVVDETDEATEQQPEEPQPQLSLLKCLDLYHGPELEKLAKDHVIDPERSYAEDHSHIP